MAMQAVSIPQFLLPRLTWTAATARPVAATLRDVPPRSRHGQSRGSDRSSNGSLVAKVQTLRANSSAPLSSSRVGAPLYTRRGEPSRRPFSTSTRLQRDHHFDTLKFVQRLQSEGFTEAQAQALMRVLSDVIEESIQNLTRTMVLREDAQKTAYQQTVDLSALRTELFSMDNNESALTRASHERLTNEIQKLNNRLRDEVQRTQASVRLDLNLEKGRIREEGGSQELKIKETETRIEQEVASLKERVEAVKFSTLQWLMGVTTGTAAIILGAWRLLM